MVITNYPELVERARNWSLCKVPRRLGLRLGCPPVYTPREILEKSERTAKNRKRPNIDTLVPKTRYIRYTVDSQRLNPLHQMLQGCYM